MYSIVYIRIYTYISDEVEFQSMSPIPFKAQTSANLLIKRDSLNKGSYAHKKK